MDHIFLSALLQAAQVARLAFGSKLRIGASFEGGLHQLGMEAYDIVLALRQPGFPDKILVFQTKRLQPNGPATPRRRFLSGTALGSTVEDGFARAMSGARLAYSGSSQFDEIKIGDIRKATVRHAGKPQTQIEAILKAEALGLPVYYMLYSPMVVPGVGPIVGTRVIRSLDLYSGLCPSASFWPQISHRFTPKSSGLSGPTPTAVTLGLVQALGSQSVESLVYGATQCRHGAAIRDLDTDGVGDLLRHARAYVAVSAAEGEEDAEEPLG